MQNGKDGTQMKATGIVRRIDELGRVVIPCMDKQSRTYQAYVQILKEELIPAMGCTEPIAIAYAAAKARDVLGGMPDKVEIGVSSNIIKN